MPDGGQPIDGAIGRSGPDSRLPRRIAIFKSMPLADLAPEEYAEISCALCARRSMATATHPLSVRAKRLKSILAKLNPPAPSATVTPYPAPRPSAEPSFLYAKLRGVRRRR